MKLSWMRWTLLALAIFGVLVLGISAAFVITAPYLKQEALTALSNRAGVPVRLEEFSLSLWPPLQLGGSSFQMGDESQPGRLFLQAKIFSVQARPWELWSSPRRVRRIRVEGVRVILPASREVRDQPGPRPESDPGKSDGPHAATTKIDRIDVQDLEIQRWPSTERQNSTVFQIHKVQITDFALDRAFPFTASLTYPRPRGKLEVGGTFGPWNRERSQNTSISGSYRLLDANMGDFRGIQGLLTTEGTFQGNLHVTQINGTARIPDFMVIKSKNVIPLQFAYEAERVSGEVRLREVEARFRNSILVSTGSVTTSPAGQRLVSLQVTAEQARVEDLIHFGLEGEKAPLEGDIRLDTNVRIPLLPTPFIDRLFAEGDFVIEGGVFTSLDIQKTLAKISQIGTGAAEGESGATTVSDFDGEFVLREGRIDFSRLQFGIPGAGLNLKGSYGLKDQSLDFRGEVLMERSPSEMVPPSWARWVRVIDPVLGRGKAGTVVPIKIKGSRSKPSFAPDF